jgi:hypothetical protein
MNCRLRFISDSATVRALCSGLLLGTFALTNEAAQTGASFTVAVKVRTAIESETGLCRNNAGTGAFGATVTVVCATGAVTGLEAIETSTWRPIHGGAYRYLTQISKDQLSGTIDSYAGVGTSTAFRVAGLPGREYVEMTVGW